MKLMKITLKMAFHDSACGHQALDFVADQLVNYASETLDAEIVLVEKAEKNIDLPDPTFDEEFFDKEIDPFEEWQKKAEPHLKEL